jgi:hypothetical protein
MFVAHPCLAPLPHGPRVPAPIVLTTSCGAFKLARHGGVTRLPAHWLAYHGGGTGRRWGADLQLRRSRDGRIVILRRKRLVWRSRRLYRNDGGDVAFGPGLFAFSSYRRGIFVTDYRGPERLVVRGRGLYPYDFTHSGRLLVVRMGRVEVRTPDGRLLRTYRYSPRRGFAYDDRHERLYFVRRGGQLVVAHGTRALTVARLRGVAGGVSFMPPGLLVFGGGALQRRGVGDVTVTDLHGKIVARARWRGKLMNFDSGLSVSRDGRSFAFRLSNARPGAKSGSAAVFILRAGERRARLLFRHRLGPSGCAVGAGLNWHQRYLLYRTWAGRAAVLDSRTRQIRSLASVLARLPKRWATDIGAASWLADFR